MPRQFNLLVHCFELIVVFPLTLQQRLYDARENRHASDLSGLVPVRPILDSISITKHRIRQLDVIHLVRDQREHGKQDLAFHARPFVLCGMPLRRPSATELVHRRQNGKFFLEIIAHPRFGLPFGQDRLIPIWAATLSLKQKSRTVHFKTAAQLLEFLKLPKDDIHYRRIVEGFQRIFAASIFFGIDDERTDGHVFDCARFHFFDRMELWFDRNHSGHLPGSDKHQNVITLSQGFYEEVNQHSIPVERPVVIGLVNAPGLLDFYVWLVRKSWAVKTVPVCISLFGLQGLEEQLGSARYTRKKRFRQTLRRWQKMIKVLRPACLAELSTDGRFLIVRSSCHSPAIRRQNG